MGAENPPQTMSPGTSYSTRSTSSIAVETLRKNCMATMIPRPAQPTPGSGPPTSMHLTPLYPLKTTSDSAISPPRWIRSIMVGILRPTRVMVESLFGSQPTTRTLCPSSAHAAAMLEAVQDLPIPPLPYMATCLMGDIN
ncbi:Uncharacterised protein [uncultured archaeon]|nr:Uncharacterised protein [uncultured archaeon]